MRTYLRIHAALISALILVPMPQAHALAHPFHGSIAMVDWNPKTKSMEVALRVDANDLDQALSLRHKRRVDIEQNRQSDKLICEYLRKRFLVASAGQKPARLQWVGKEIGIKTTWLYFEFPGLKEPESLQFENRVFFELQRDQLNTINVKIEGRRKTIRCRIE